MGGGLMQLVAYGAQDIYLTGNPQITFFKVVYRRHTNFSMECIQQTVNGTSTIGATPTSGTVMLDSIIGQESFQICCQLVWASWREVVSGFGFIFGITSVDDKMIAGRVYRVSI